MRHWAESLTLLASFLLLVACTSQTVKVRGAPLNCDDYVSHYAKLEFDLSNIKAWQGSIGLSLEQMSKFETLQTDYILDARTLCQRAPLYFNSGKEDEWICRDERLSRSREQLRVIVSTYDALRNTTDAKAKSSAIIKTVELYFNAFRTEEPCTVPPSVKKLQDIEARLDLLTNDIARIGRQVEVDIYRERFPISLTSIVEGAAQASRGIRNAGRLLLIEFYFLETEEMLSNPSFAMRVLGTQSLEKRLTEAATLESGRLAVVAADALSQIRFLQVMDDRSFDVQRKLKRVVAIGSEEEKRQLVHRVIKRLESPDLKKTASVLSYIGTLSLALGDREQTLKHYYESVLRNPEHLPGYDGLSYALWRLNSDSYTAKQYSALGLRKTNESKQRIGDTRGKTLRNIQGLLQAMPYEDGRIKIYAGAVDEFYADSTPALTAYIGRMNDRFAAATAYYSALELDAEAEAKRLAKNVLDRNESDPDYLDVYGFVMLRFWKSISDIDAAVVHFERAKAIADTQEQRDLINLHIDLAARMKERARRNGILLDLPG